MQALRDGKGRTPLEVARSRGAHGARALLEGHTIGGLEFAVLPLRSAMHGLTSWLYETRFAIDEALGNNGGATIRGGLGTAPMRPAVE